LSIKAAMVQLDSEMEKPASASVDVG